MAFQKRKGDHFIAFNQKRIYVQDKRRKGGCVPVLKLDYSLWN